MAIGYQLWINAIGLIWLWLLGMYKAITCGHGYCLWPMAIGCCLFAMAIAYCMWLLPMAIDYWLLLLAMAIACGYGYWLQPMDIYTIGYYGKSYWLQLLPMVIGYSLLAISCGYWLRTIDIYTMGYYAYNYWLWIKVLPIGYSYCLLVVLEFDFQTLGIWFLGFSGWAFKGYILRLKCQGFSVYFWNIGLWGLEPWWPKPMRLRHQ